MSRIVKMDIETGVIGEGGCEVMEAVGVLAKGEGIGKFFACGSVAGFEGKEVVVFITGDSDEGGRSEHGRDEVGTTTNDCLF